MRLIAGLGNPTRKYKLTRHNVGFLAIDRIAKGLSVKLKKKVSLSSLVGEATFAGKKVILQKPLVFMNLSGKAISAVVNEKGVNPEAIMVICDDINLALGRIRLRRSGSSGGHNGLKSIIEGLGTDQFSRLRIGIGSKDAVNRDLSEYVLQNFNKGELTTVNEILDVVSEAINIYLTDGIETAMNRYNNFELKEGKK